ncbi:MAG TPA: aminopeptidase P family protein [Euryarchaeota archaeon]|nr:MAG: aminopeptidase P family protein [Aciduliprofundum sp.]HEU12922.1 aminopeptidase P family protein [Euryarchaeota archaeon]
MRMNRIERLKKSMEGKGEFALISPGSNFYYLTDLNIMGSMERLFLLVVPLDSEPFIIAPELYGESLHESGLEIELWKDGENPYLSLKKRLNLKNKIFFVEDSLPSVMLMEIMKNIPGSKFHPLSSIISSLRMIKEQEEIEYLKKAAYIADMVFKKIIGEDILRMSEKEIASLIEEYIQDFGGDSKSFDAIVAKGKNTADPHHIPGNSRDSIGPIILDFGAKYRGYCSDITRTLFLERVTEREKEIYSIVREAQERAIFKVLPGIRALDIDKAAREYISEKGYGEYFIHRTGHGIGLDVHEEPFINNVNPIPLQNGMVFTVEPGIYIRGDFGIRIEDDVLVDNKQVILTKAEKDIIVI